ncbi:MAG: sulfotransferase, partial [Gammaproteobacteria bacterium]
MAMPYLGENLVFIISQPRSGSTLLQRILGAHTEIAISSEPWIMLHPVYGLREQGISTDYSADWAVRGVTEFLDNYTDGQEVYDDGIRAFAQTIYLNAMAKA